MSKRTKQIIALVFIVGGLVAIPFLEWPKGNWDEKVPNRLKESTTEQVRKNTDENLPQKRNLAEAPADVRELAEWMGVPSVDSDNVPQKDVTYMDSDTGLSRFRFYITGGKNDTDFGQAEWTVHRRSDEPVTCVVTSLGHSLYLIKAEESGEPLFYMFVDNNGDRLILSSSTGEQEYVIIEE